MTKEQKGKIVSQFLLEWFFVFVSLSAIYALVGLSFAVFLFPTDYTGFEGCGLCGIGSHSFNINALVIMMVPIILLLVAVFWYKIISPKYSSFGGC